MSGHSKWHNIKLRKGKVDAQRGALFTKLSKEIILAAKGGSPDPEANYRLKMAVEKARENNMPADNIKRAIARASGAGEKEIEEIRYEGYGPGSVAVIVDAAGEEVEEQTLLDLLQFCEALLALANDAIDGVENCGDRALLID